MFFSMLKSIILSGIFICIIHYIIYFFIETLTVPKVKDLIHISSKQQELLHSIKSTSGEQSKPSMKSLKTFLKSNNAVPIESKQCSKPQSLPQQSVSSYSNIISFSDYE
jgi:hypothetical protein